MPEWIELLAGPIQKGGFDFVAPLYSRYKYDGTITNTVTYPMTRALYGLRIRQPIGGDFGVSGDLVRHYLEQDDWDADVSKFGIDIWMTTKAITGGFAVCQTRLGAKVHDPKDPGADLGPMFCQVVGTLLRLTDRHADRWLDVRGSHDVPDLRLRAAARPAAAGGQHGAPARGVRQGQAERAATNGRAALAPDNFDGRRRPLADGRGRRARRRARSTSPTRLWARVVYDMAVAWHAASAWPWTDSSRRSCRSTSPASPASSSRRQS